MTNPITVIRCLGPKLVPFMKSVLVYFVLWLPEPSAIAALVKILPIISLAAFVIMHGVKLPRNLTMHRFCYGILAGLVFSCIGDIFLVFNEAYFIHGLLAFAIAQLIYAINFGFKPFKWSVLLVCTAVGMSSYILMYPGLFGPMIYLAGVYIALILYMIWRAVARLQFFEKRWTWSKLAGSLGAVCFAISDLTLGINKFVFPVPYVRAIVMFTYYAAQLGIVLSVVDYHRIDDVTKDSGDDNRKCVDVNTNETVIAKTNGFRKEHIKVE
ncbi:lysoplasmalogenase TMEM86A-like [Ptychodera flava]|uniref:lysoplasmalogenase TMEM86A-like n=1 Tax=Ptychodera flava TaxID=63121 RepID=UPI00396A537E